MKRLLPIIGLVGLVSLGVAPMPYPLDGFERTGIRRLLRTKAIAEGRLPGRTPPPGAMKGLADIRLTLTGREHLPISSLPDLDRDLTAQLSRLFAGRDASYSVALMDITPGREHRLAFYKEAARYQPGSVGKLAILSGLFAELQRMYPDSPEDRRRLLKSRMVTAGPWVRSNHHTIPVYDPDSGRFASRAVLETDTFSLYEWADHAVSASSNAAASVLWKEVLLMRAFGTAYPPAPAAEKAFFDTTPKGELGAMASSVVNDPLRAAGISEDDWRLGSLFTNWAQSTIRASGGSWGNPRGLLTYLLRIEEGRMVDEWSSLEIKRLLYQTERRIRYAASPRLADAAVYFKSGSLYKCKKDPGEDCGKYRGNVDNYMNSVATVETADGRIYLVTLMSNVLRINSASEHMNLASEIERIMSR